MKYSLITTALILSPITACHQNSDPAESKLSWQDLSELEAKAVDNDQPLKAFPTAEGYGANTPGGRGGKLMLVTSLKDDGSEGTLRHAIESSGKRIIMFAVDGVITLQKDLEITEPFLTIAGQTAGGTGITIVGSNVTISTHDVILRYLRFRMGSKQGYIGQCKPDGKECTKDTMSLDSAEQVIIDHCSFSWSVDEVLSGVSSRYITIQYSIISDPLRLAENENGEMLHDEQHEHGYCSLFRGSQYIDFHHNIYANCEQRTPQISGKGKYPPIASITNNFIYNYENKGTKFNASSGAKGESTHTTIDIIGNYYETIESDSPKPIQLELVSDQTLEVSISGNKWVDAKGKSRSNCDLVEVQLDEKKQCEDIVKIDQPLTATSITLTPIDQLKDHLLQSAGANFPSRDSLDQSLIDQIEAKKDRKFTDGSKTIAVVNHTISRSKIAKSAKESDQDNDLLPDKYERKFSNDIKKFDPNGDHDKDGYTNIEEYIESLISAKP